MSWATKTLYPVEKWLPLYAPNDPWEVVPLVTDPNYPNSKPPSGVPTFWWKFHKSLWPYKTPWAKKEFGVLPPMQTWMADDHTHHFPPLGVIKVNMYDTKSPQGQQISFQKLRMHMRHLSPDEMKLKMASMPFGFRYYARKMVWDRYTGSDEYIEVKSREIKWNYPGIHPFTQTSVI
jgi:hypothetical protein